MQVKIPKEKVYHSMFYNYISEQDQKKYFPLRFQQDREAALPMPKPVSEPPEKQKQSKRILNSRTELSTRIESEPSDAPPKTLPGT